MPRTSNFKVETNTDTKQDDAINLIHNTLISLGVPTITFIVPPKSLLTFYVDGSCGLDTNDGSREQPYKTIQSAINKCESIWDGTAREIKVMFSSYNENLTISKPRVQIVGECPTRYANVACGINGVISVNIPSGFVDLFNSQVCLMGFQIVGRVIDNSLSPHTLNIKDCFLYGPEYIIQQKSSSDCRTYLENLTVNASNANGLNPLIAIEKGNVEITSCNITAKSANTNCLHMSKNALICACTSSNFTNDSSASSLKPLIYVHNIGTATTNSFVNCNFLFSATTTKTVDIATGNNSAIATLARDDYFIVLRCAFALQGVAATSTNYIILPHYSDGGTLRLSQSNNVSSIGTAYKICSSGVTQYPFTTVA